MPTTTKTFVINKGYFQYEAMTGVVDTISVRYVSGDQANIGRLGYARFNTGGSLNLELIGDTLWYGGKLWFLTPARGNLTFWFASNRSRPFELTLVYTWS